MALDAARAGNLLRFHAALVGGAGRLERYRRAIAATVRPGDVVLDLGAGVGVLGFFALESGAEHVYAVESSSVAGLGRAVAERNGLGERITFLESPSAEVELERPADVLVADIFETWGLNAGLLATVLDARARLLVPGARLLPHSLELFASPVSCPDRHKGWIDVWRDNATGVDLSAIAGQAASVLHPIRARECELLADGASLGRVDLTSHADAGFSGAATFETERAGLAHGLAGWFRAELTDDDDAITNAPQGATVDYNAAFAPFAEPLRIEAGMSIDISVDTYDGQQWRWQVSTPQGDRSQSTIDALPVDVGALKRASGSAQSPAAGAA